MCAVFCLQWIEIISTWEINIFFVVTALYCCYGKRIGNIQLLLLFWNIFILWFIDSNNEWKNKKDRLIKDSVKFWHRFNFWLAFYHFQFLEWKSMYLFCPCHNRLGEGHVLTKIFNLKSCLQSNFNSRSL